MNITNYTGVDFDLQKAVKNGQLYSSATGIDTTVIDNTGRILFESCLNKNLCLFCRSVNDAKQQVCSSNYLLYGGYQAERFGGRYVFFCPYGLTYWASPIISGGMMAGAILGGPVLMMEPDDFLMDEIIRKNVADDLTFRQYKDHLAQIQLFGTEKVNKLSELLLIIAKDISNVQPSYFTQEEERYNQQSDISGYLQYRKQAGGDREHAGKYPFEKEKELISLISLGDKEGSQKVLNEIFGCIFFSFAGNFDFIKARTLELIVLLSRAAMEGGADIEQIFGLNCRYISQINEFKTVEELTYWLSKIMGRFTDCVFTLAGVKHNDMIFKALNYIKKNYMKKLSLAEVAEHVYLSPSYFSKVFKEEMKCSFKEYLNHIRIEISKNALLDDSVSLSDVSDIVGYEDQSYFTKVFKKMTGLSPGRYRETRNLASK